MRLLLLTPLLALLGCGPAPAPKNPEAEPVTVLEGKPADGPHATVEDWCKKLGAPACEARTDLLMPIARTPVTTGGGQKIEIVSAATSDGKMQHGVPLLKRADGLWALPPVLAAAPGTKNAAATVGTFVHYPELDPELVLLRYTTSMPSARGGHPDEVDGQEIQDVCSVAPGKPVSCVRVVTGVIRDWPGATKEEATGRMGILAVKGHAFDFIAIDHGPADPSFALMSTVLKNGSYELRFP